MLIQTIVVELAVSFQNIRIDSIRVFKIIYNSIITIIIIEKCTVY